MGTDLTFATILELVLDVFVGLIPAVLALFLKLKSAFLQNSLPNEIALRTDFRAQFVHSMIAWVSKEIKLRFYFI